MHPGDNSKPNGEELFPPTPSASPFNEINSLGELLKWYDAQPMPAPIEITLGLPLTGMRHNEN